MSRPLEAKQRNTEIYTELLKLQTSDWLPAIVRFYDPFKGYGFLIQPESPRDVFIHSSTIRKVGFTEKLPAGRALEVRVVETKKGLAAIDLRLPK